MLSINPEVDRCTKRGEPNMKEQYLTYFQFSEHLGRRVMHVQDSNMINIGHIFVTFIEKFYTH